MSKILWIDTETTGLDAKENSIIHTSGIIEINGETKEKFNLMCHPYNQKNNSKALQLLHLTEEEIFAYPPPAETKLKLQGIWDKYIDKYNQKDKFIIGGYNVQFDMDFLQEFFLREDDPYIGSYVRWEGFIDVFPIIKFLRMMNYITLKNAKLKTVAEYFGIKHDPHDSMSDIEVTREISRIVANNIEWKYTTIGV